MVCTICTLTIRTSIATFPYSTLNVDSLLMTLMNRVATGANRTICKMELITTNMAQKSVLPHASLPRFQC